MVLKIWQLLMKMLSYRQLSILIKWVLDNFKEIYQKFVEKLQGKIKNKQLQFNQYRSYQGKKGNLNIGKELEWLMEWHGLKWVVNYYQFKQ